MLNDEEIKDFIKRLDNDDTLNEIEIKLVINNFKNKIIKNIKKFNNYKKVEFFDIIPSKEYEILLRTNDNDFDTNEFYMSILLQYNFKIHVNEYGDIDYIIKC